MSDLFVNPHLQHQVLTPREMAFIADVKNPGFELDWQLGEAMVVQSLRISVEDSFRLYPGTYEQKWGIDREEMLNKLREMTDVQILDAARQVDAFWDGITSSHAARTLSRLGTSKGGQSRSRSKVAAARRNGKLGGRPRKQR